ncbi:MAG: TATA binding protein of transcription factor TFIID [Nanoarchaeotal virus 1]|nr:MAG: TATA binding protein of transcription factor TFIID [Nanoarchaeotal virus 1]
MVKWQITNINVVAYFDTPIKIDKLAEKISQEHITNYRPEDFPGLVLYFDKFRVNIFRTGTMVITGIKKVEDLIPVINEIRKLLKKYGINLPTTYRLEIATSSISGEFDYKNIDIERINYELENTFYDPETFPAVIVRYNIAPGYKISFNIFRNGYFVGAGFKSKPDTIIQHIDQIVNEFQEEVIKRFVK